MRKPLSRRNMLQASLATLATVSVKSSLASDPVPRNARVCGQITDENGAALAGATVTMGAAGTSQSCRCDPEGRFRLTGFVQVQQPLRVSCDGYLDLDLVVTDHRHRRNGLVATSHPRSSMPRAALFPADRACQLNMSLRKRG